MDDGVIVGGGMPWSYRVFLVLVRFFDAHHALRAEKEADIAL